MTLHLVVVGGGGFQVTRLEGQVMRYKTAAENAEKVEDELKAEKRKLQREVIIIENNGTFYFKSTSKYSKKLNKKKKQCTQKTSNNTQHTRLNIPGCVFK